MIRISSSLTLGLALFFPVFWFVLFGSLTIFILYTDSEDLPVSNPVGFKTGLFIGFIFFAFIIYKFFAKLKRVEIEKDQLFVTNYFKTIAFPAKRISEIKTQSIFGLILVTLVIDYKTYFGKKIRFLTDPQKLNLLIIQKDQMEESD